MFVFTDSAGENHLIGSGQDMLKALNQDDRPRIYITDETGALVGAGVGIEGAQRSQPLVKALRDAPMAKSFAPAKPQPRMLLKKSAGFSDQLNQLTRLNKSLAVLQKSMNVGVQVSDDSASDDVWSLIADFDARISALEVNIKTISDFIASL
jgi:cytochrome c556